MGAPLCGIERKSSPEPLSISVIIPCHPAHFPLLGPLFEVYGAQTSLPEEIVVSLSEWEKVGRSAILELEGRAWPFAVKIVTSIKEQTPGKNRNVACFASSGDLIVCQDADDLPHPQRIEAIRYLFEEFEVEHLLHAWLESSGKFSFFEIEGLERRCETYRNYEQIRVQNIHNGSTAFLRRVFEKVHWHPFLTIDEDSIFNRHASAFFRDHYVLSLPLIQYRGELSTFDLNGDKGSR